MTRYCALPTPDSIYFDLKFYKWTLCIYSLRKTWETRLKMDQTRKVLIKIHTGWWIKTILLDLFQNKNQMISKGKIEAKKTSTKWLPKILFHFYEWFTYIVCFFSLASYAKVIPAFYGDKIIYKFWSLCTWMYFVNCTSVFSVWFQLSMLLNLLNLLLKHQKCLNLNGWDCVYFLEQSCCM